MGVGLAIGYAVRASAVPGRVRIAGLPPGEAPEEIRQAWVGLELPLARGQAKGRFQNTVGVLSNQPTRCGESYAVDGPEAVRILAATAPEAAAWWRLNAPHVVVGGYFLVFPAEVCERVA